MDAQTELDDVAERCWRALDTVHVTVYFAPEPTAEYAELGIRARAGYFLSRSAAMGAVSPEVTIATFYVFAPGLVRHVMRGCWDEVTPEAVTAARQQGVAAALHRVVGDPDVTEAVELGKQLCAGFEPQGRALYAGHAALAWPEESLVALWHVGSLVREFRGDAHMAALMLHGLDPVEALVLDAQVGGRAEFLKATRGWSADEWSDGGRRLVERGLLEPDGTLTEAGGTLRGMVDTQTRRASAVAWQRFGAERTARLRDLVRPLARQVADSDVLPEALRRR